MTRPPPTTLVNGVATDTVPVDDRGLTYGDGLFETMAIIDGRIRRLELHLERLAQGCVRLGIECPPPVLLTEECSQVAQRAVSPRAVLKLILTRGAAARGVAPHADAPATRIVGLHPWPRWPDQCHETGITARWCRTILSKQPRLAGIKHLSRLEYVLARTEWTDPDITEGLLCDAYGNVICGTRTNVFIVRGGEFLTPLLDHCGVAGTTRQVVLARAKEVGIPSREARLTILDVQNAVEVFVTNALAGVWPVSRIDDRRFTLGPMTQRIARLLA